MIIGRDTNIKNPPKPKKEPINMTIDENTVNAIVSSFAIIAVAFVTVSIIQAIAAPGNSISEAIEACGELPAVSYYSKGNELRTVDPEQYKQVVSVVQECRKMVIQDNRNNGILTDD